MFKKKKQVFKSWPCILTDCHIIVFWNVEFKYNIVIDPKRVAYCMIKSIFTSEKLSSILYIIAIINFSV